jgi:TolA-binding protein
LRIMQQKMRNRLGNLEQRLRNAQNKILEIENIYEEQIYNVRTQGEAYQWYYTYGLISQLPRD